MSNKALVAVSILFSLLLLEAGMWLVAKTGAVNFEAPTYSLKQIVPFWRDLNPDFGVWHPTEHRYRHRKSCFDIEYRSNAFGARDPERKLATDAPRAVVLGDSFVEGYGVAQEARFSDILERQSGCEHLNFGTAGNFGPTQYLLLYRSLASRFTHDMVIVGILPDNDFINDDYELGKKNHRNQYRPYWVGDAPDWRLVYYKNTLGDSSIGLAFKYAKGFLREFSYAYRGLDYLSKALRYKHKAQPSKAAAAAPTQAYSGYYDFTERQWQVMAHNLSLLAADAKGKRLLFVTIPRHGDFLRQRTLGGEPPLPPRLRELAAQLGAAYLDLMPAMQTQAWDSYFLTCDDHWSPQGHAAAAALIQAAEPYQSWLSTATGHIPGKTD